MTREEIIELVNNYANECDGIEYDGLDEEHLINFLMKRLGNN